jgi:hypothetical protein
VKLESDLINTSMANSETRLLYFDEQGKLTPLTPQRFEELIWNPKTQDFNECILSNEGMPMSAKWYSKQNNTTENFHLTTCWSVNIGTNNFVEGYKLNVAGAVNTSSNYYINGTPIRQSQWLDDLAANEISFNGNVKIGNSNTTLQTHSLKLLNKATINSDNTHDLIFTSENNAGRIKNQKSFFIFLDKDNQSSDEEFVIFNNGSDYNANKLFLIKSDGACKLDGNFHAKAMYVCSSGWCDYVFEDNYNLKPLSEVEKFIKENKHLPDVPSAKEIENNEVDVFEMIKIQMKKIEELTLYNIQLQKQIDELKNK